MTKSGTSDSIGWGMGPSEPTPGFAAYNAWLCMTLTAEQHQIWRKIAHEHGAKSSHDMFLLWQKLICLPKTNIALDFDLVLVQPAVKYGDWTPNDILICRKWVENQRKQLVFSPEAGFCGLFTTLKG